MVCVVSWDWRFAGELIALRRCSHCAKLLTTSSVQDLLPSIWVISPAFPKMAAWYDIVREARRHRDATVDAVESSLPPMPDEHSHNVIDVPGRMLSHDEVLLIQTPLTELLDLLATSKVTVATVASFVELQ